MSVTYHINYLPERLSIRTMISLVISLDFNKMLTEWLKSVLRFKLGSIECILWRSNECSSSRSRHWWQCHLCRPSAPWRRHDTSQGHAKQANCICSIRGRRNSKTRLSSKFFFHVKTFDFRCLMLKCMLIWRLNSLGPMRSWTNMDWKWKRTRSSRSGSCWPSKQRWAVVCWQSSLRW